MKQIPKPRVRVALALVAVAAAVAFPLVFGSCTPGNEITASESDVALTIYDNTFDFGKYTTYYLPDTIVHLTGDQEKVDDPNLSRDYDRQTIQLVKDQMAAAGYTWVDSTDSPDLLMGVSATSVDTYSIYSYYPYYPGWGGYCCYWYPWYPTTSVSYAYTTGTLIIVLTDATSVTPDRETIPVRWSAALNGVLNDSSTNLRKRVDRGIPQLFTQSPYLRSNQ